MLLASPIVFAVTPSPLDSNNCRERMQRQHPINQNESSFNRINFEEALEYLSHIALDHIRENAPSESSVDKPSSDSGEISSKEALEYLSHLAYESANIEEDLKGSWLIIAVQHKSMGIIKFLVERGANVNMKDRYGSTPLLEAIKLGHIESIEYLIEHGADVDYGNIPLIEAVKSKCSLEVTKCLIDHFADPNLKDRHGNTALSEAVRLNNVNLTNYLIEHGADVNWRSRRNHNSLIHITLNNDNLDLLRCLIEHKAPLIEDLWGNTPLIRTIKENKVEAMKLLCDITDGYEKDLALFVAKKENIESLAQYLKEHGAYDFENMDFDQALKKGMDFAKRYLVHRTPKTIFSHSDRKKDFKNFCKRAGGAWLITAIQHNNLEIVKFLVENGANINTTNEKFETPLTIASRTGNESIVNYLLDNGAK